MPVQYFCERCRPADHEKLLGEVRQGERPWEDRRRERERAEEESERPVMETDMIPIEMGTTLKKARGKRAKKKKKGRTETNIKKTKTHKEKI